MSDEAVTATQDMPPGIASALSALGGSPESTSSAPAPVEPGGTSPETVETPPSAPQEIQPAEAKDGETPADADANPAEAQAEDLSPEERAALLSYLEKVQQNGQPQAPVDPPAQTEAPAQPPQAAQEPAQPKQPEWTPLPDPQAVQAAMDAFIEGEPKPMIDTMASIAQNTAQAYAVGTINAYNQQLARALPAVMGELVEIAVATVFAQRENPALEEHHEQVIQAAREARVANPNASVAALTKETLKRMQGELVLASALKKFKGGARLAANGNPGSPASPNARSAPVTAGAAPITNPIDIAIARLTGKL